MKKSVLIFEKTTTTTTTTTQPWFIYFQIAGKY